MAAKIAAHRPAGGREKVVHARYSSSEFAAIEHASASAGMTVSGFLRSLSLDGAGVLPFLTDEDRAVLALIRSELRAIGVNLNGLARAANHGAGPAKTDLSEAVARLWPALAAVAFELDRYTARIARRQSGAP